MVFVSCSGIVRHRPLVLNRIRDNSTILRPHELTSSCICFSHDIVRLTAVSPFDWDERCCSAEHKAKKYVVVTL